MTQDSDYDELARMAEAGLLTPVPGTAERGDAAAALGRRLLMDATSTTSIEAAARIALGRPRVGEDREETHLWRVRTPKRLDAEVTALAARMETTRSSLIRTAVAEYVERHSA